MSAPTPSRTRRPSLAMLAVGAVGLVIVMLAGILLLGRLANSDVVAMVLTTVFFIVILAGLIALSRRQRAWLLPLGIPFVLVAMVAGVVLGRPLVTDKVVDEQIVVADDAPSDTAPSDASPAPPAVTPSTKAAPSAPAAPPPTSAAPKNVKVASGNFQAIAHPGRGTATLIRTTGSGVKLTFTGFSTDNGPDIRVYLSRGTKSSGKGASFVDLGTLKGNKGNQQYNVPADVNLAEFDSVVLWCRAFDVGFIQAPLRSA